MIDMSDSKAPAPGTITGPIARVGTVMRAPKTAELIATHLRNRIVKGELKPGQTLPAEVHLMEQFGVSRPTFRGLPEPGGPVPPRPPTGIARRGAGPERKSHSPNPTQQCPTPIASSDL